MRRNKTEIQKNVRSAKSLSKVLPGIILVLGFSSVVCFLALFNRGIIIEKHRDVYNQVQFRTSKSEVIDLLGSPDVITSKTIVRRDVYWDDEPLIDINPKDVKTTLIWQIDTLFLPIIFEYYFDSEDKLIGKYKCD